ncbi:MAG: septal ring lytic transglycosylase RlpA family protein [Propionibacteriaceae bacterium]|nr:septal ring lytic transglycosylase RlpA family protein [Propionibacteriaceae bacterium]
MQNLSASSKSTSLKSRIAAGALTVLLGITASLALPTQQADAAASAATTVVLNVRSGPSTSHSVLTVLPKGAQVSLTGDTAGQWTQITWSGRIAWVATQYLSTSGNRSGTDSCKASYYGEGRLTANGESFDPSGMTAAHKTLPFGTKVKVTNPATGKSVTVRINDRGPYISGRCLDLTTAAFAAIADPGQGVVQVDYQIVS